MSNGIESVSLRDGLDIRQARQAIDTCGEKTTDFALPTDFASLMDNQFGSTDRDGRLMRLTCPKYPEGTEYLREALVNNGMTRGTAALRLGCAACEFRNGDSEKVAREVQVGSLHEKLREVAGKVYIDGHYSDSVMRGCITVQDALYDVSGYNTAQEAIGKGGLTFPTDRNPKVQKAHEQAAQFTLMAVDNLRNEEAHAMPSPAEVAQGAAYAYPRLMVCSLALGFIDTAQIRQ